MLRLLVSLFINAAALWVASLIMDGITLPASLVSLLLVALVFGLVNTFIRPIIGLFTLPLNLLTLGLFTVVINALMLMLTGLWSAMDVSGFWTAVGGSLIVSVVSVVLNMLVKDATPSLAA